MDSPYILAKKGLSHHEWQILDEKWGPVAQSLHKLNLLRDFHGPYKHCLYPPKDTKYHGPLADNDKIGLIEIRYGLVPELNPEKPCLWFILRHKPDSDGQLSPCSLPRIEVEIVETINGEETLVPIIDPDIAATVYLATECGSDTYALAAKIPEPFEWFDQSGIERKCKGKIERDKPLLVHMQDSKPTKEHICGLWVARDNWF